MRYWLTILLAASTASLAGCQSTPIQRDPHALGYSYSYQSTATDPQHAWPGPGSVVGAAESTVEAAASVVPLTLQVAGHLFRGM